MAGELTALQRRRLARRTRLVERRTGLEVVVYVGRTEEDADQDPTALLKRHHAVPLVLLLVEPVARRVAVRTTEAGRARLSDEAAQQVLSRMRPALAAGRLAQGVLAGLEVVEKRAGRGKRGTVDLPEVLDA